MASGSCDALLGRPVLAQSDTGASRTSADRRVAPLVPAAARRVALVVGNQAYQRNPLRNAVADAQDVGARLTALRFETTVATDVSLERFDELVTAFTKSVGPGDVALFYFSGHGVEIEGRNYLLPVDFKAETQARARREAIEAQWVLDELAERGAALKLVILDACRDNPLPVKSGGGGLAAMDGGEGSLVIFATAPKRTASDNPSGRNGLFTAAFIQALEQPGLGLYDLFRDVTGRVARSSNRQQIPWQTGTLIEDFVFLPATSAGPGPSGVTPPVPSGPAPDFSGLATAAKASQERLTVMRQKTAEAEALEAQVGLAPALIAQAWEMWLKSYGDDDPVITADDQLRAKARDRLTFWRAQTAAVQPAGKESGAMPSSVATGDGYAGVAASLVSAVKWYTGEAGREDDVEAQKALGGC